MAAGFQHLSDSGGELFWPDHERGRILAPVRLLNVSGIDLLNLARDVSPGVSQTVLFNRTPDPCDLREPLAIVDLVGQAANELLVESPFKIAGCKSSSDDVMEAPDYHFWASRAVGEF